MRKFGIQSNHAPSWLTGQMLIAMPTMTDRRFRRAVIYMCSHSSEGAMGLIVNQQNLEVSFGDLMVHLGLPGKDEMREEVLGTAIMVGGPVASDRGFVLHTSDYFSEGATLPIADGICLTATLEILDAIARGKGPRRATVALGYSGWAPGQLEYEIGANVWLHGPPDHELLFGSEHAGKYERALSKLGIERSNFVTDAGHA